MSTFLFLKKKKQVLDDQTKSSQSSNYFKLFHKIEKEIPNLFYEESIAQIQSQIKTKQEKETIKQNSVSIITMFYNKILSNKSKVPLQQTQDHVDSSLECEVYLT